MLSAVPGEGHFLVVPDNLRTRYADREEYTSYEAGILPAVAPRWALNLRYRQGTEGALGPSLASSDFNLRLLRRVCNFIIIIIVIVQND